MCNHEMNNNLYVTSLSAIMMKKLQRAIKQSQPNQSQIVCSTMHFMGILREVRCVIKQGFGGRSPPRQKQNKIDYYNKNKQCADRRVDLYERNTKWPSRRQLSATCLSPLCSTWCLGLALELFELHIFDIQTWPKEASNKNEIFLWLAKIGKATTPVWGGFRYSDVLLCVRKSWAS